MSIKYKGYKYRQNDSSDKWLFSFVASCEQVRSWAGIPRKSDDNLEGFQRPDNKERIAQISDYFDNVENVSPTSIILGMHSESIPRVSIVDLDKINNNLYFSEITIDHATTPSLDEVVDILKHQIDARLCLEVEEGGDPDEEPAEDDEEDAEAEIDEGMGVSILKKLRSNLDDSGWCSSNREHLEEMAKPATIIDGQHRIEGAADLENNIHFNFTALIDCGWAEQVFQFTAINYTSQKIQDSFITANAALSLTKSEMETLKIRLSQAKVKVLEHTLIETINFDPSSPFFEWVDLTSGATPQDKLGYKTMVGIAKVWYDASHPVLKTKILPKLYPSLTTQTARRDAWRNENAWSEYLLIFWRAVHDVYKTQLGIDGVNSLWSVGNSSLLNQAIVIRFFQTYALNYVNYQTASVFETSGAVDDHLRDVITNTTTEFASFFNKKNIFSKKWEQTSLNTGAGKEQLNDLFTKVAGAAGEYNFNSHPIITGRV